MIPIYKPYLPKATLRYSHDAIDSGWLSKGKYINIVQERLQELLEVKHVLLTNNGTSATHLVAKALQKEHLDSSQGEFKLEVLTPDNVYVAAWNSLIYDQDLILKPISADVDSWNFDLSILDDTKNHRDAIFVVHNLGNIVNVPELQRKYPETVFVEDNCEGFLGKYEGQYSGTASLASSISFFGNKNITSGEGGALITNNTDLYEYANCIHGQGQSSEKFIHSHLGYNYRITNIQASLLLGQLDVLDEIIEKKLDIFESYRKAFFDREDIKTQKIDCNTEHSNWMFAVRIIGSHGYAHAEQYFKDKGIEVRPMFYPIIAHKHLAHHEGITYVNTDTSELLNKECFVLPSYPELTQDEVNYIVVCVNEYVKTL